MPKLPKPEKPKARLRRFYSEEQAGIAAATPVCPHFGDCGGCQFQDLDPAAHADWKWRVFQRQVAHHGCEDLLAEVGGGRAVASPIAYDYRGRMDYACILGEIGLRRRKGSPFRVVDLQTCSILGDAHLQAARRAHQLCAEAGLDDHDPKRHCGTLRYVVVRANRRGQRLLALTVFDREHDETVLAVMDQLVANGVADSAWLLHQPSVADLSFGDEIAHRGEPHIIETLDIGGRALACRIGPNTFFQANAGVAELAYAAIRAHVAGSATCVDAFSGTATIAMAVADVVGRVQAIENHPGNLVLAAANLAANGISNVEQVAGDAVAALRDLGDGLDAVIVDPPRSGLGDAGALGLLAAAPRRIAYLSCNAETLLAELRLLSSRYRVVDLQVYDMFPQTVHYETLVLLERRTCESDL